MVFAYKNKLIFIEESQKKQIFRNPGAGSTDALFFNLGLGGHPNETIIYKSRLGNLVFFLFNFGGCLS